MLGVHENPAAKGDSAYPHAVDNDDLLRRRMRAARGKGPEVPDRVDGQRESLAALTGGMGG